MESMKVAELVSALHLIGKFYRNKDGSKSADAIVKILDQVHGFEEASLKEWVEHKKAQTKPGRKPLNNRNVDIVLIESSLLFLENQADEIRLNDAVKTLKSKLNADHWKAAAKRLLGKTYPSARAAQEDIATHYSNRLLLKDRVEAVQRGGNQYSQVL